MSRKLPAHQRMSRREAFRLAGAAGAVALVGRTIAGEPADAQQGSASPCVMTPALTEGPYFVDEKLNRSDIRIDPSDNSVSAGVPLVLNLMIQRVENGGCTALTGATVDVWHCDALGDYSDEAALGTGGKKYLRGYQVTDANGAVQFTTIYPGWYMGRAVHIHFKVRLAAGSQTYQFTSQFFFDDTLTDAIYAQNAPYNTRRARDTRNSTDGIYLQPVNDGTGTKSGELLLLQVTPAERAEDGLVGSLVIGATLSTSSSASTPGGPGPNPGGPGGPGGRPPAA